MGDMEPGTETWNEVAMECPFCHSDVWYEGLDDASELRGNALDYRRVFHCGVCELTLLLRDKHLA